MCCKLSVCYSTAILITLAVAVMVPRQSPRASAATISEMRNHKREVKTATEIVLNPTCAFNSVKHLSSFVPDIRLFVCAVWRHAYYI